MKATTDATVLIDPGMDLETLRQEMPADLQVQVTRLTDEWFRDLVARPAEKLHEMIQDGFHQLLGAEATLLLQVKHDVPLELIGAGRVWPGSAFLEPRLVDAIQRVPTGSGGPEQIIWPHLSGETLRIPITDRKKNWLALVLVAGPRHPQVRLLAQLLRSESALLLENVRTQRLLRDALTRAREAKTFEDARRELVRSAHQLVRANRSEIAYWDWARDNGDFVVEVVQPAERENLPTTTKASGGLIGAVWDDPNPAARLEPDVRAGHLQGIYKEWHVLTRSELLIRINQNLGPDRQPRRLGVINLESFKKGGEGGFDEQDRLALELLVNTVAEESNQIRREQSLKYINDKLSLAKKDFRIVTRQILESVRDSYGFDRGILYRPNYQERRLEAFHPTMGTDQPEDDPAFSYPFDEPAAATWAFHHRKQLFTTEPWNDPRVNQRGVKEFGIDTPLLAIPLILNREAVHPLPERQEVVGVLVLWTHLNPVLVEEDMERLEPFTRLAAIALDDACRETRRRTFDQWVDRIQKKMQVSIDLREQTSLIMDAALAMGFDRVRVFRFQYGDTMVPYDCRGMGEFVQSFLEHPQDLHHPYAASLIQRAQQSKDPQLVARFYPNEEISVPDPHAAFHGKRPDRKWIAVPLVSAGKLYGELAVDNANTEWPRPYLEEDLGYITQLGVLAARAFAIDEKRGMLHPLRLAELQDALASYHYSDVLAWRCLLRFLTHGNGGLGFHRAVFFQYEPTNKRYRVVEVVGSPVQSGPERFSQVARAVSRWELREVLARAGEECDRELYETLKGCTLSNQDAPSDLRATQVSYASQEQTRRLSLEIRILCKKLIGREFLLCRIDHADERIGLVLVDRAFDTDRPLSEGEQAVLESFARQAGQLLALHRYHRDNLELQRLSQLGRVTSGLTHELRQPLTNLQNQLVCLRHELRNNPLSAAMDWVERMQKTANKMDEIITELKNFHRTDQLQEVSLRSFLDDYLAELRPQLDKQRISLETDIPDSLPRLRLYPWRLRHLGLDQLLRNAREALAQAPRKSITLRVRQEWDRIDVEVQDTGPGLPEHIRQALDQRRFFGETGKPGRGLGIGLSFVDWIAREHGGNFVIKNGPDGGAVATISLPTIRS